MITIDDEHWHRALMALCRCGGMIGLSPIVPGVQRALASCSVRVLALSDEGLVIERPEGFSKRQISPGAELSIHFAEGSHRWACSTCVVARTHFPIGRDILPALHLAAPRSARSAQRRRFLRAAVENLQVNKVRLIPLNHIGAPFEAILLNISGGGIGVEAPSSMPQHARGAARYRCQLTVPTQAGPLVMTVRLTHAAPRDLHSRYLGLCFEYRSMRERSDQVEALLQFTTRLQRAKPRRRAA